MISIEIKVAKLLLNIDSAPHAQSDIDRFAIFLIFGRMGGWEDKPTEMLLIDEFVRFCL